MNKQSLPLRGKKIIFAILFLLAFLERVAFDLGPNFEFVTGAMLLAAAYLGTRYSLTLVLVVMVLSDLTLGNTNIFLFTWSGFLIPALVASKVLTKAKNIIVYTKRFEGKFIQENSDVKLSDYVPRKRGANPPLCRNRKVGKLVISSFSSKKVCWQNA